MARSTRSNAAKLAEAAAQAKGTPFLSLPIELRFQILRDAFNSESDYVKWSEDRRTRPSWFSLFLINRQISNEAQIIFRETKSARISWWTHRIYIRPNHKMIIKTLRTIDIAITGIGFLFEWGSKTQGDHLTPVLQTIAAELIKRAPTERTARISINFRFDDFYYQRQYRPRDTEGIAKQKYVLLYMRTQLRELLRHFCNRVQHHLPRFEMKDNLNMDVEEPDLQVYRVDKQRVNFKDPARRTCGAVYGGHPRHYMVVVFTEYTDDVDATTLQVDPVLDASARKEARRDIPHWL